MSFQHAVLPNGLTVIGEWNPQSLTMAAGYFVRTGARDESPEVSGVSHFLEHMQFKGTGRRTAEQINLEFDSLGADYNAFTGEEYTVYYGAVLPERQDPLLDLLTDMMRPTLLTEDFDMEKNVILEEIALYKDQPQHVLIDEARSIYYAGHPLANVVLGTTESITALTPEQMRDYHATHYRPSSMLLTLAGNYSWKTALAQVGALTGSWEPGECARTRPGFSPPAGVHVRRDDKLHREHVAFMAPGVPAQDDRRYVAEVIGFLIGGGEGSKLHWELVDPGLADTARLSHDEEDGLGTYFGYLTCEPGRTAEVLDRTRSLLARVMSEGFSPDDLERGRRKIASALVLHDETPRGRLFHLGFDWQYRGECTPLDEAIDRYLAVSLEDIRNFLADRPFDRMTVVALGPVAALS